MSAHGFRSLYMAAGVAGAALGCYLISLNVASERSKLEAVEAEIASTQRDIRVLQTEIGTRGRLAQLERWNANFIRLSAPSADQFLEGGFQLASMVKPRDKPAIEAPVVLAAAPVEPEAKAAPMQPGAMAADEMMHVARYETPVSKRERAAIAPPQPPATSAKPVTVRKTVSANGAKTASADPLAPLSVPMAAGKAPAPDSDNSLPHPSRKPKDLLPEQ